MPDKGDPANTYMTSQVAFQLSNDKYILIQEKRAHFEKLEVVEETDFGTIYFYDKLANNWFEGVILLSETEFAEFNTFNTPANGTLPTNTFKLVANPQDAGAAKTLTFDGKLPMWEPFGTSRSGFKAKFRIRVTDSQITVT